METNRRKLIYVLAIGAAIVGLITVLFPQLFARAVTNVAVVDNDTTGFGLDGRDFRVTWTPGTEPAGYQFTHIYIVSSTINLTTTTLGSACTGSPGGVCMPVGFFNQHSFADFTLPQFILKDSNNQTFVTDTSYVAWVYVSSTVPTLVSSTAISYENAFDIPVDLTAPQIDHMPAHGAVAATNAVINAMVFDDQTLDVQFANTTDDGGEYLDLYYGSNVAVSATATSGVQIAGSLFKFTIPAAAVPNAGGAFQYYIIARDRVGNARFFCSNPSANSTSSCQSSPFTVNTVAQGSRSVAGTIANGGVGVSGAKVFPAGFALNATTTDASGNYILQGLPDNDAFDFTAFKPGYCRNARFETISTVNKTGIDFNLNAGTCGFFSGGGGSIGGGGSPIVIFSGPPEGSNNVPQAEKIRVGLSQPMSASTINDNNAADAGSNSYLTTDDGTTKVAGSVVYCETSSSAGCSSLPSQDTNVILFVPATNLATNIFYTFVITEKVTNQGGQSINSNRPGGGHKISFTTGGGIFGAGEFTLGTSGQFMPPYVRSMVPAPGVTAAPNIKIIVEFDQAMDSATINTANVNLVDRTTGNSTVSLSGVSLDSNEKRFVAITPASALISDHEYELRIKGAVANPSGITMRPPDQASQIAFSSFFKVSGSNDETAPTIYPMVANNSVNLAVSKKLDFGFSEQLDFNTINNTNITFSRAGTSVGIKTDYDSGKNNLMVIPTSVLAPNTVYTLVLGNGVKDLAGNRIATGTYTYTTGAADSVAPTISEARCDDYTCSIIFSEPMNSDAQVDTNWVSSTVNHQNITLTQGGADKVIGSTVVTYDAGRNAVMIQGVNLDKISGISFTLAIAGVTDLSGNVLVTQSIVGPVEDSSKTFGSFSGGGMFAPPTSDFTGSIGGGEFQPQGFGSFTAEQFALGQADRAFPFNQTASQDVNVFQVQFSPGVVIQNGDTVQFTFPNGTDVTNAALDTLSPMNKDMNMQGGGTITGTGVAVSASANTVTVTLGVSGTTGAGDSYTIDLRKITNPSIPKDPTTGGYTLDIKVSRSGSVLANRTTMPYFIKSAGTNNINIRVYADSAVTPTNVAGTVQLYAGGPSGAMNKTLTIAAGQISAVDGSEGSSVAYTNLSDGCYFFGTDPSVTLSNIDYFGQMSPEPICVSGGATQSKNIVLTNASSGNGSVTATIKLAGIANFGGVDIDLFAGGPGRFVVKTLSAVGVPAADGYTIKLPANGMWSIGVGPSMPKGSSGGIPKQLPGVPPAPIMVNVAGLGTDSATIALANSFQTPGAVLATNSTTITFTFAAADKTITGKDTDGTTGLQSVNVFLHRQGFGAPVFGTTNASGTFSLAVSDYGSYMIGANKDGLPPTEQQIEVRTDGADAGTDPDVYFQGKQITDANPFVITLKKADYTISGKILDTSGNGVGYASVFGMNASNGQTISGRSSGDGSYSLFVGTGVWNLRSELPPDKSDICGTLSLAVTITTESKSSQNLSPSASTCYTLSGTVSVGGSNLANAPLFVQEWDTTNSRPVAGGSQRGTMTNSSGAYSMKVAGSKTYRIGTWHSDYGELSATKAVTGDTAQNITVATLARADFLFTGGSSVMNAMVELKNASDGTKVIRKQKSGLDSSLSINTESGATYNYFIDVPGVGKFTGSAAAESTTTVALGITSTDFVTVTGTIKNNSGDVLVGALVMFSNTSTGVVQTASTDSNGQYSINVKSGSYSVGSNLAGYVPGQASQTASFTMTTGAYDFGGENADQTALQAANKSIEGTLRDSSGQPMTNGYVWAENTAGLVVSGAVNASDGTYSLPVTTGAWTVSAVGPKHAKTIKGGTVSISGSNSTGNNITLTADNTRIPTSTSGIIAANAGGSVNDSAGSGIKLTAGSGVLETGSSNITLNLEKNYTAPETQTFSPLANTAFKISATGDSAIKNLNGNAEIQISYGDLVSSIPSGASESDLKLMYLSPETGDYVPVEGGFTVDAANNTITGLVNHFTDFVIAYVPPTVSAAPVSAGGGTIVASGGGGGFSLATPVVTPVVTTITPTTPVVETTPVVTAPVVGTVFTNPASDIKLAVSKTDYTAQQKAAFNYIYTFTGKKATMVKIVRQVLNSKGKVVFTTSATKKLKPNGEFTAKVNHPLTRLTPGTYTMRVQIFGPKLLDQNSFSFSIAKPKKKHLVFGEAEAGSDFTLKVKVPTTPVALPYRLAGSYSYVNTTDQKQQITMVREMVSATGKTVEKRTGVWTLKPGEADSVAFKTQMASNLILGKYTYRMTAYDRKTKKLLSRISWPLEIIEK